ncbi:class I SAM-dependent methyltransferase [Endozoicomonas sp. SM1973]|uniref:Class I SAM-dependent methyltransferase n=1 Tax=Spartinivicinus marinus TaxID=2994442 RepID=A0A853HWP3_9GAMM|nr:class I SAM-dependent methyltransferase [Spartinivicinus marinus]MCX4028338.1 class I SAM-dependent methyltransferase [Spartinivicinus marinus]NYZ65673.1 class I SAM-dependent methyltransferase [Spartinivicinus marinus]
MKLINLRIVKKALESLIHYPFHPQWYTAHSRILKKQLKDINSTNKILDIGCYDKWVQYYLDSQCSYIGLDYLETASNWYFSKPDIFGDAHTLPFSTNIFDKVLLLNVLEHVSCLDTVLKESFRVLKKNGEAIIQIPFLYPIHDAPRDFIRITQHGMADKSKKIGFKIVKSISMGHPLETAALLKNIAISKTFINCLKRKNPLCIATPILPFYFLFQNLTSFILSKLTISDNFMPYSYIFILKK